MRWVSKAVCPFAPAVASLTHYQSSLWPHTFKRFRHPKTRRSKHEAEYAMGHRQRLGGDLARCRSVRPANKETLVARSAGGWGHYEKHKWSLFSRVFLNSREKRGWVGARKTYSTKLSLSKIIRKNWPPSRWSLPSVTQRLYGNFWGRVSNALLFGLHLVWGVWNIFFPPACKYEAMKTFWCVYGGK